MFGLLAEDSHILSAGLSTFESCLVWETKKWEKIVFCRFFCVSVCVKLCISFNLKSKKLCQLLPWCRRFYMLGGMFCIDAGDLTCLAGCFALMRVILHVWCENSVQVWDSGSMHESWQPCHWSNSQNPFMLTDRLSITIVTLSTQRNW